MPHDNLSNKGVLGVTVQTWGTKASKGNGMLNFMDQQLFGGDVGHASINMKLPVNETTQKWIETYCCKYTYAEHQQREQKSMSFEQYVKEVEKIIPVTQEEQRVRQANYDESGHLTPTQENAFVQQYFDIDFSWWPGRVNTTASDMILEREGKHVNYAPEWKKELQPVQRLHRGKLGQRLMDYAPLMVAHQRDMPDFVMQQMAKRSELQKIEEKQMAITNLNNKIKALNSKEISPTMKLMFQNISLNADELLIEFETLTKTSDEILELQGFLEKKVHDLSRELNSKHEELTRELANSTDVGQLKEQGIMLLNQLNNIHETLELSKNDHRAKDLYSQLDVKERISYSGRLQSAIERIWVTPELNIENLRLTPASVDHLLELVDLQIAESSQKASKGNAEKELRFKKYQEIVEEFRDDTNRQAQEFYDNDMNDDEEIEEFANLMKLGKKTTVERIAVSPELQGLKELLIQNRETGIAFDNELEIKLNGSLKNWRNDLPEPCQLILPESVEKLKQETKALMDEQTENEAKLSLEKAELEAQLEKINKDLEYHELFEEFFEKHRDLYFTLGEPAHNTVNLPFATPEKRGLDPEQMLIKMHHLIAVDPEKFNLYRKNCSLTSIEVLKAGTQHDVTLNQAMDTYALGFFGTPQQVLANAQNALQIIDTDTHSNKVTQVINKKYLERALGSGIGLYMDKEGSRLQQAAGAGVVLLAGTAKLAKESAKAMVYPSDTYDSLTEALSLAYERDSTLLKVGATMLLAPTVVLTGAMSGVSKGVQYISSPLIGWFSKPTAKESMDEITTPVVSASEATELGKGNSNAVLAALLNQRVKKNLDENTIEICSKATPEATISEFKEQLASNPEKVVVLDKKAHKAVIAYVLNTDDKELKEQFYAACTESAARAAKQAPKTKDAVITVLADVIKAKIEPIDENQNDMEDIDVPEKDLRTSMK